MDPVDESRSQTPAIPEPTCSAPAPEGRPLAEKVGGTFGGLKYDRIVAESYGRVVYDSAVHVTADEARNALNAWVCGLVAKAIKESATN